MAGLRGMDDCGDTYAVGDCTMFGWTANPASIQSGYVAGGCIRFSNQSMNKTLPVTSAEWTVGFHWRPTTGTTAFQPLLTFLEGATVHARLLYDGGGTWTLDRNGTALAGGTSGGGFGVGSGAFATVEIYVKINDTTGAWELRLNGVTVFSGSAKDTQNGGTGLISVLRWTSPAVGGVMDLDDIWYDDTPGGAFRGDVRAIGTVPNAAGNYAQWTPNASTNVSRVDDATPNADTDYNSSATPNQIDTFGFAALPVGSAATVHGVMARMVARKDDAAARTIAGMVRRGGTDYVGTTSPGLTASYLGYEDLRVQDPSTGPANWTVAGVDAGEYGYKEIT